MKQSKGFIRAAIPMTLLTLGMFSRADTHQDTTSRVVVEKYIALSSAGNLDEAKQETVKMPSSRQRLEPSGKKEDAEPRIEGRAGDVEVVTREPCDDRFQLLFVQERFPKMLHLQKMAIQRITKTWAEGDEAKVSAVIRPQDARAGGFEWEFSLLNVEGRWRIFKIDFVRFGD